MDSSSNSYELDDDELEELYYRPKTKADAAVDSILEWIETIVLAVFAMILIMSFVIKYVTVSGDSMNDTLFSGDRLVVSSFLYTPEAGDIVVVNSEVMQETIIKRVIAVGGQAVQINYEESTVTVDGELMSEDYVSQPMSDTGGFDKSAFDEETGVYNYVVPTGCVFLMGDNRNHSTDSRVIGVVNESEIVGKVVFRFYSENAQGKTGRVK